MGLMDVLFVHENKQLIASLKIDRSVASDPLRRHAAPLFRIIGLILVLGVPYLIYGATRFAPREELVVKSSHVGELPKTVVTLPATSSVLDASGYVVPRRQATVSTEITGRVEEVYIEEGQQVAKGQVLAKLNSEQLEKQRELAEVALARATALLHAAQTTFNDQERIYARKSVLAKNKWISAEDMERATAEHNALNNAVAVSREDFKLAKAQLRSVIQRETEMVIRSPFDGVVTNKTAQAGEIVSPMSASGGYTRTGICTIVDMNSLEVEVDISESYIHRISPGQPAMVKLNAYADLEIPAYVIAIIPTVDRAKATVKVRVGFKEKEQRLVPEMGARVTFSRGADGSNNSGL